MRIACCAEPSCPAGLPLGDAVIDAVTLATAGGDDRTFSGLVRSGWLLFDLVRLAEDFGVDGLPPGPRIVAFCPRHAGRFVSTTDGDGDLMLMAGARA